MAISYNPQNGDVKTNGVTTYPFDYQRYKQTITSTDYSISPDNAVVTCFITLSNGAIVSGVHEQYQNKDVNLFKTLAYQRALDRAEQLGYRLI